MFTGHSDISYLGRKNDWPCITDSIWQEPSFCPYYGSNGCPCQSREDRPCECDGGSGMMDAVPFLFFF